MQISAGIAAQLAVTKQNVALSVIKQSAESDKAKQIQPNAIT